MNSVTARVGHEIARLPTRLRHGLSLSSCDGQAGVGRLGVAVPVDVHGGEKWRAKFVKPVWGKRNAGTSPSRIGHNAYGF
eukprot:7376315-Prymnesium_polylepis.1